METWCLQQMVEGVKSWWRKNKSTSSMFSPHREGLMGNVVLMLSFSTNSVPHALLHDRILNGQMLKRNSLWPLAAPQSVLSTQIQAASLKTDDWLLIGRLQPPHCPRPPVPRQGLPGLAGPAAACLRLPEPADRRSPDSSSVSVRNNNTDTVFNISACLESVPASGHLHQHKG